MNKFLLTNLLIIVFSFSLSAQSKNKPVLISGSVKNMNLDTIAIVNAIDNSMHKIGVDTTGTFKTSQNLPEGYYNLAFQREYTGMYLKPGYELQLNADMESLDQSIKYTGKGSNENNFLANKYRIVENYLKANPSSSKGAMSESDFLKQNTALHDLRMDLLSKTKDIDENFRYLEKNNIDLEQRSDLFNFPLMMRFQMGQPDFKTSDQYPNAFKDLDVNNEKLITIPSYSQVVLNYVYSLNNEKMIAGKESDLGIGMLNVLDSLVKNEKVKSFMAIQIGEQLIEKSKSPEQFYTKFASIVKDEEQRTPVREKYVAMKSLEKGMPSPDFSFTDMAGKFHSLKDFKGKYLYIDVWATWCGPCKMEIPYLKTLEEELHDKNIEFVSICTFDEKSKWEAMVKEKDLKGTQLFAPRDNDFVKKYNIQGIPRFLLIDKDGKILSSDSKRPSDPTLKDDLLKLP